MIILLSADDNSNDSGWSIAANCDSIESPPWDHLEASVPNHYVQVFQNNYKHTRPFLIKHHSASIFPQNLNLDLDHHHRATTTERPNSPTEEHSSLDVSTTSSSMESSMDESASSGER